MPTNHGRPHLLAVAVLLLLLAAALLVTPAAADEMTTISSLPYSDEQFSQSFHYADVSYSYVGGATIHTGTAQLMLVINHVERFQHIHYISMEYEGNLGISEGTSYFWYKRPSDNTYVRSMVITTKARNTLSTITHTQCIFYFLDWDTGTTTGSYSTYLYADNDGVKSSNYFSTKTATARNGAPTLTTTGGDSYYTAGLYYYHTNEYADHSKYSYHVEQYQNDGFQLSLSEDGQSIKTTIGRFINTLYCPSQITMYNSTDSIVFQDYGNVNRSFLYPTSKCDHVTVTVSDTTYVYYLPSASTSETSDFSLSLSSSSVSVGDTFTAILTPAADAPRYSEIAWTLTDPEGNIDVELYSKSSDDWTTWQHYNKTSFLMENSSSEAAHNLPVTPTSAGTWTVSAVVRDQQPPSTGAALASLSASCSVSRKAGDVDVIVSVFDGAKTSTSYLSGVGVTVWDLSRNSSVIYDSTGEYIVGASGTTNGIASFTAPLGDQIRISVEKSGYVTHTETDFVQPTALPRNQMPISITLMPAATPSADWVYLSVTVTTVTNSPIEDASVVVGNHTGITNAQGICKVSIPANTTLSYSISATGYYSTSGYVMPVSENSAITVQLNLVSSVVTTSPIGNATPNPDTRTNAEKSQSALDMLYDNAEAFVALCLLATFLGILKLIAKW